MLEGPLSTASLGIFNKGRRSRRVVARQRVLPAFDDAQFLAEQQTEQVEDAAANPKQPLISRFFASSTTLGHEHAQPADPKPASEPVVASHFADFSDTAHDRARPLATLERQASDCGTTVIPQTPSPPAPSLHQYANNRHIPSTSILSRSHTQSSRSPWPVVTHADQAADQPVILVPDSPRVPPIAMGSVDQCWDECCGCRHRQPIHAEQADCHPVDAGWPEHQQQQQQQQYGHHGDVYSDDHDSCSLDDAYTDAMMMDISSTRQPWAAAPAAARFPSSTVGFRFPSHRLH
ncbi:hypothetical protein BC831DRAFT_66905 [Entophlyctis helioformis]|nr:hypothetical protein BC831DRAFT_66905 [Entophlyctis helioformis]